MIRLPRFPSKAFLAPMAGISDPAFRLLCKEQGAGLVVTELTSVHAIVAKERLLRAHEKEITDFIEYSDRERPVAVQLFGHDIDLVCKAARIVEPYFDIIDFNMGCPAPHITQQMAGAALLQKSEHTRLLFEKLIASVDKPVTLKLRAGINAKSCYLFKDIARIAERAGVRMITLHARTLEQGYSGKSDWGLIKQLKGMVSVPVVGNGDIRTPEDAKRMLEETSCDYVMIGRAAMGNPYIFSQVNDYLKRGKYDSIEPDEKAKYFFKYLDYTKNYHVNFSVMKNQAMQFTGGLRGAPRLREMISRAKTEKDLRGIFLNNKP